MARPTTWTTEKVEELADQMELYFIGEKLKFEADDKYKKIPFIGSFCRSIAGISHETLLKKAGENEKLSETLKNCKEIQKEILIQGGLDGRFNATSFIFTSKNITDMRAPLPYR